MEKNILIDLLNKYKSSYGQDILEKTMKYQKNMVLKLTQTQKKEPTTMKPMPLSTHLCKQT